MSQSGNSTSRKKCTQLEDKRKMNFSYLSMACDDFPSYSTGDILYMVLRNLAKKKNVSVSFLRGISDEEFFKEIDFRITNEKE